MTLKAYFDNIKAQTGKSPEDFIFLAKKKGLLKEDVKTGQIVAWLMEDFGLGHGHAMAIVMALKNATRPMESMCEKIAKQFKGDKARWRGSYEKLLAKGREFGQDVSESPPTHTSASCATAKSLGSYKCLRSASISVSGFKACLPPAASKRLVHGMRWLPTGSGFQTQTK